MKTLNTNLLKSGSLKHLNVRVRAAKSIVPYSLVIASLVLSGATATEAHAAAAHAKAVKPAHVITHVARRHALPTQQIDPAAQFFQGWFGGPPVVHTARSRADQGNYAHYEWSTPVGNSAAQAEEDAQRAAEQNSFANQTIQQAIDESNAASAQTAADGAQAAQDSVNAFQFEMSVQNGN